MITVEDSFSALQRAANIHRSNVQTILSQLYARSEAITLVKKDTTNIGWLEESNGKFIVRDKMDVKHSIKLTSVVSIYENKRGDVFVQMTYEL